MSKHVNMIEAEMIFRRLRKEETRKSLSDEFNRVLGTIGRIDLEIGKYGKFSMRKPTPEFRQFVVEMAANYSVAYAVEKCGVSDKAIYGWKKLAKPVSKFTPIILSPTSGNNHIKFALSLLNNGGSVTYDANGSITFTS